ncbi:MAG: anti-sigma factor [Anaerolineae bacterium]|nr:anti-sigma factor [Anaerolineae bacterium]
MSAMSYEEARELLAAYALGALSRNERAAVEAQLQASAELRAELAEHLQALAQLTMAEPERELPSTMKADLLARIGTIPAPPKRSPLAGLLERLMRDVAIPRFALVTAGLVGALALGGLGYRVVQLSNQQIAQQEAMALLADASAQARAMRGRPFAPNATGTIRFKPDGMVGLLEARNLPVLERDKVYQLWLVYPDNTRDTGALFNSTNPDGTTTVVVVAQKPFSTYVHFGISVEPAGGMPGPTGPGALSTRG